MSKILPIFWSLLLLLFTIGSSQTALAATPADDTKMNVELLFVQSATDISLDKNTLTLKGISPKTIFFSDRPERIAGQMFTETFVGQWSVGPRSFAADPPNASLSLVRGDDVANVVLELRNPRLQGTTLTYDVTVAEGETSIAGETGSLFIDIIGRPLTPLSFAGVARRSWRRAAWVGAGAVGTAAVINATTPAPTTVIVNQPAPSSSSLTDQLKQLKSLYDQGLISESEYQKKQGELLKNM